ncbi:MAG: flagellar biosynthesis anti-sigma factor FlgM [Treponema sp.]|jgi:negative regulator of flagellin synthesis FlgM|nr:flagellar biosynthesis anti-sigma factor FlgM [Treponema sp.]
MTVGRIGHIDPIQPGKKPGRTEPLRESDKTDSIHLSSEALEKAEIYQVVELIKSAPEIGEDRIAELREKINDPSYINEKVVSATADKIMDAFGL